MSTGPGAAGLLWLWAAVADLGPGGEPEQPPRYSGVTETPEASSAAPVSPTWEWG